ncbi:phospholipase D-like domain-containing protein [Algibacter sp. L1A34]|uniref:phospholipase D-like domain-containing protein n=1 Tax=Algibacter sp. L1A34 TaxID=2686365 RepID=UPI00131EAA82|nr:phospholipase D-like domain-containing protein [Algibacter sp. L1A34]
MNNSLINKEIFEGGYFVLNDNRTQAVLREYPNLLFTLDGYPQIKNHIIKLIRNAVKVIKLCSFIISDEEIAFELLEKCKNTDVAVFLLTQLDDKKFNFDFLPEEVSTEEGKEHMSIITKLYGLGAHVRAATSAHAKFIVCDNWDALIMSANITSPSLNTNPETGVILKKEKAYRELDKLFDILFQKGTEYVGFTTSGKKQLISSRSTNITKETLDLVDESSIKFTWGKLNNSLYESIVELIKKANSDIFISTYSVVSLDKIPELVEELTNAIDRGLAIKLFCRAMNHRKDHLDSCLKLKQIGIEIYGDYFNHSKGIYSNDKGILFTANIDGNHGLINGFEVGAIIQGNQLNDFKSFVEWQIETAPFYFTINPNKQTYYDMYDVYTDFKKINNPSFPSNCIIHINTEIKDEFFQDPIYLLTDEDKNVLKMKISDIEYDVKMEGSNITVINKSINKSYNMQSYLLKYKDIDVVND